MHWTLEELLSLPVDYYTELIAMLEEEARQRELQEMQRH